MAANKIKFMIQFYFQAVVGIEAGIMSDGVPTTLLQRM